MLNTFELLDSAKSTLNDDLELCEQLRVVGKGRVYIGPDFPDNPPERFISLSLLSNNQDIDTTEVEFSTLGVTIAVIASHDSDQALNVLSGIAQRVNTLIHNKPTAFTLTGDLIGHVSREGSLPPDTERLGQEFFLISQERFEILTTEGN